MMNSAMDQTRYWMWSRRKLGGCPLLSPQIVPGYNDSWEEQAFAAEHLGGCVWPPRSYSCSFCRREFRSAQALGGHMNVHRRDRARLKQIACPIGEEDARGAVVENESGLPAKDSPGSPRSTRDDTQQEHIVIPVRNPNPSQGVLVGSPSSPSTVLSSQTNSSEHHTMVSLLKRPSESPILLANLELKLGRESWDLREVESISSKRQKIDSKPYSRDSEVLVIFGSRVVEELDLELRLGDSPSRIRD